MSERNVLKLQGNPGGCKNPSAAPLTDSIVKDVVATERSYKDKGVEETITWRGQAMTYICNQVPNTRINSAGTQDQVHWPCYQGDCPFHWSRRATTTT